MRASPGDAANRLPVSRRVDTVYLPWVRRWLAFVGALTGCDVTTGTTVTVTCRFDLNGGPVLTSMTSEVLPPGRVGFSVERWEGRLDALHVLDHP